MGGRGYRTPPSSLSPPPLKQPSELGILQLRNVCLAACVTWDWLGEDFLLKPRSVAHQQKTRFPEYHSRVLPVESYDQSSSNTWHFCSKKASVQISVQRLNPRLPVYVEYTHMNCGFWWAVKVSSPRSSRSQWNRECRVCLVSLDQG